MAVVGPGHPLLRRIADALGIQNARHIVIEMRLNDVVTVEAGFMPDAPQLSEVAYALEYRRYHLVDDSDEGES